MKWLARLFADTSTSPFRIDDRTPRAESSPDALAQRSLAVSHIQQGNQLLGQSRLDEAIGQYRAAARADSSCADAFINLGFALSERGATDEATSTLQTAIALAPESEDARYLLGCALLAKGWTANAVTALRKAIELQPSLLPAYRELGKALHLTGRHADAIAILRSGLAIDDTFADCHFFIGNIHLHEMRFEDAMASYRRALELNPESAAIHNNIAQVLLNLCDFEGAAAAARMARRLDPAMTVAHSNLLMSLSFDGRVSPKEYLDEARLFGHLIPVDWTFSEGSGDVETLHEMHPGVARVGFVSADLHSHPVGYFLEEVLAHWNRAGGVELFAYNNGSSNDELTARLKKHFVKWREVARVDDPTLAELIRTDGIDVLVDLSGHTAGNRLQVFARRVAPVQATWLGYWASTGLQTMDFVLADRISVPIENHGHFSEAVYYLPHTRLCFSPPTGPNVPDISPTPALNSGYLTFGSFQRLTKLNDDVLGLWAEVLDALPTARLRVQSPQLKDEYVRQAFGVRLENAGIDLARVRLLAGVSRTAYLQAHAEVDVLLDTFPHSGGTTTCESLWMGVPTVTLAGETMLARQGASLLENAGLANWIAKTRRDYVAVAVGAASDIVALGRLREQMRAQVFRSPIFDARGFASNLEQCFLELRRNGRA